VKNKIFLFFAIIASILFQTLEATVYWTGGDITSDVTDDNIVVSGDNYVCADILVHAATKNIVATISADARLIGKVTTGVPRLALFVENGYTITFALNNNLTFLGALTVPLIVTVKGNGSVRFVLSDDKVCQITSALPNNMGTQFFIITNDDSNSAVQIFRASDSSSNVELAIGPASILSFAATDVIDGTQTSGANLQFNPSNTGTGRMIVRIADTGCLLVQGNKIPSGVVQRNLVSADFDLSVPAGKLVTCTVAGSVLSSAGSSLFVLNMNAHFPDLLSDPWKLGIPCQHRYGCIVGPDGKIIVSGDSYFDYVGLTNNMCPQTFAKPRNASALIMDGIVSAFALPATIALTAPAGVFLRSGVASDGSINPDFTVDPHKVATGMGNVLFDVEGMTALQGTGLGCAFELLSLQVNPTGGSVVIDYGLPLIFPLRTFTRHDDVYLRYNTGCCMINNALSLFDVDLVHSDENHVVYACDTTSSEPTYVGGESFSLTTPAGARPCINFNETRFKVHASVALTGVDLSVIGSNPTTFTFFYNGWLLDDGIGRTCMLGTDIGSLACDATLPAIATNANLTVSPTSTPVAQHLLLQVAPNNGTITEGITGDISNQFSTHLLFLGNASTITLGTNGVLPITAPQQTLTIDGKYFSIETKIQEGCTAGCGSTVTGIGTIFVDSQGVLNISEGIRANMASMVLRGYNGSVQLPKTQVRFAPNVGISHYLLNLNESAQRVIISSSDNFANYTLDWTSIIKGYENPDFPFVPYSLDIYPPFGCPVVTVQNISSLPTVQGAVEQFQIKGSRLGDEAYLMVDGGTIYELTFLDDCGSARVEGAVVAVQNGAYVGLGSRERDRGSLAANTVLGVNGVTLIPNGNARIELNEDIIINDICHILAGPDFGLEGTHFDPDFDPSALRVNINQTLEFHSDLNKAIIVKAGGQLDLTSLNTANKIVSFSGNANLVLEPGAKILMNGGTLLMTDKARVITHTVP
jgi:hypothetical protein